MIDSSVAAKWFLAEENAREGALRLLEDVVSDRIALAAPPLFEVEMLSIVTKSARCGRLDGRDALTALQSVTGGLGLLRVCGGRTSELAFQLALTLGRSPYDCQYLAVALEMGCDFYTADRRFVAAASRAYPCVKDVADYGA